VPANNHSEIVNFIWSIAELLRDSFKRSKYQDVILPLTVLRRIDCVLEPTKNQVLEKYNKYKDELADLSDLLRSASGFAFYNTSPFTFEKLLEDPPNIASNLNSYINSFSENMREVIEKFDFRNTITKLDDTGLLFLVVERFKNIDLHPDKLDNLQMGSIFEELIRRFNEALDENPGEHFTPREVIRLMVELMLAPDTELLKVDRKVFKVADPACGSGGMLTIAKESLLSTNNTLDIFLYGQEVNPETYAICKSDLYMKSADGRDAERIAYGSTLSKDAHSQDTFSYQLANPPYGKEWKMDQAEVERESRHPNGRFVAGLPRISDGQMLFLQHMLSHMDPVEKGGGRVAIVMNGSPLFTGDAGSGESEIRRWIIENDWLEAIIALPEQLFYNTGIATYIWVLTNRKPINRQHKVQLINATDLWVPLRKSLGNKRREISADQISEIVSIYMSNIENGRSKVFDSTEFGYRKVVIERPSRLNFQVSPERLEHLNNEPAFISLAVSKKKDPIVKAKEEELGRAHQQRILSALRSMSSNLIKDRSVFEKDLEQSVKKDHLIIAAPVKKAILSALSERDETAEICLDKDGKPEPDPELRDTENVPLNESIDSYFDREVRLHVPDAWVNKAIRDQHDGEVGKVGYEINFNRYFYVYKPPRQLEEIESDIKKLEKEIIELLHEVTE
jgi:type I restriction enzyme M protein